MSHRDVCYGYLQGKHETQLFSDPGKKKGTLGEDISSGAATKKQGKKEKGATELRKPWE